MKSILRFCIQRWNILLLVFGLTIGIELSVSFSDAGTSSKVLKSKFSAQEKNAVQLAIKILTGLKQFKDVDLSKEIGVFKTILNDPYLLHVYFTQVHPKKGISVFKTRLGVHMTREGKLIRISGRWNLI
ncbi:MAG: hypothetical protein HYS07_11360 [Chlamydiae bacterium]|nr:hypothetical protein [Chlamydiota bacterium]MBI3278084.1 hypothetical protein [Chlamydiota bacterium]